MPAGCEFICDNVKCLQHRAGFSINSIWPLGKIELIISNINERLPNQTEYKEQLLKWKSEGRKYACLILPNVNHVPIAAYRVSLWDEEKYCIWPVDVELNEGETLEQAIERIVPKTTPEGRVLKSFNEVMQDGIKCPYCKELMKQSRWFSNNE
jgi:hypothetical protein